MKGCVWHLVSFCVFRYPTVLLTYLNLCCGQRKWRNQWMYSLSWQTRRWNKADSTLWRLCSSIALLSACQTQSKCGCKLQETTVAPGHQEPTVAPGHQDVEQNAHVWMFRLQCAAWCCASLVGGVWSSLLLVCSDCNSKPHRDKWPLYSCWILLGFCPFDICANITTLLGPLLHVAFPIAPVPVLLYLKVTHSTFCC
jgi:hypothetical protein